MAVREHRNDRPAPITAQAGNQGWQLKVGATFAIFDNVVASKLPLLCINISQMSSSI